MIKRRKIVLIPTEVCAGDYCAGDEFHRICSHFDNTGGHASCILDLDYRSPDFGLKIDEKGRYPKPSVCKNAKEKE